MNIDFGIVADIYDAYVQTDMDIAFYKSLCEGHGTILELMCGTGRVSLPLLRDGHRLTCVDYSKPMLDAFARKLRGDERVTMVCQDICELSLAELFDIAFIPFHSIAEITDKSRRRQAISRIFAHLKPGGECFISLYNPAYRVKLADNAVHLLGEFPLQDGRMLKVCYRNEHIKEQGLIRGEQTYEIYDKAGSCLQTRVMPLCFAVIGQEEIRVFAQSAGFVLREMYGNYTRGPFTPESMFMHFLFYKPQESIN